MYETGMRHRSSKDIVESAESLSRVTIDFETRNIERARIDGDTETLKLIAFRFEVMNSSKKGARELARAARVALVELGDTESMVKAAELSKKDGEQTRDSMYWYKEAAVAGVTSAMLLVAEWLCTGVEVYGEKLLDQNLEAAYELYQRCIVDDNDIARKRVAYMLLYGVGVEKNEKAAYDEFSILASKGDIESRELIAKMNDEGIGTPKDSHAAYVIMKSLYESSKKGTNR